MFEANTLHISNLSEDLRMHSTLEIFDLVGRPLWQSKIVSDEISLEPSLNFNGIYIVKISSDDYVISRKIYIKNQGF